MAEHDDGREIALEAVIEPRVQRLRNRVRGAYVHERISVRIGMRDECRSEVAACTGPIVDDHRLTPRFVELLRDDSRHDVVDAARGESDDVAYGMCRVISSVRGCARQCAEKRGTCLAPYGAECHDELRFKRGSAAA